MGIWFYVVFYAVLAGIGLRWSRMHSAVGWAALVVTAVFLAQTQIGEGVAWAGSKLADGVWAGGNAVYTAMHH